MPLTNEIFESVQHLPTDVERPVAAVAALAAAGVLVAAQRIGFNRSEEQLSDHFPNPALLEATIDQDPKSIRRQRLSPTALQVVGLGLIGASAFGNPTYETDKLTDGANVVIVEDVSYSMERTADLGQAGQTRMDAVTRAINNLNYEGRLGVIQVAAGQELVTPLSSRWEKDKKLIARVNVEGNGGKLEPAIKLADSLLPQTVGGDGKSKREGTVVVISDGTIEDSAESLSKEAAALKHSGAETKIIVPGTAIGQYKLKGSNTPISSKSQPERFAAFGAKNVTTAQTVEAVNSAVAREVRDAGMTSKDNKWYVAMAAGGLLFAVGLAKDALQRARRVI